MSQQDTNALLEKNFNAIDQRFDEVLTAMSQFAESVDVRFKNIEKDITDLKLSHDRLLVTIDGFIGRIDRYETELAARDHEIERLKRWIQEIADKTGIKLTT